MNCAVEVLARQHPAALSAVIVLIARESPCQSRLSTLFSLIEILTVQCLPLAHTSSEAVRLKETLTQQLLSVLNLCVPNLLLQKPEKSTAETLQGHQRINAIVTTLSLRKPY
eukprot:4003920-Amphidinium_carterae.1